MKISLRLMGYSIEFNRLHAQEDKEISIGEYIMIKGIPICHRDTYFKVVKGENTNVELYEQLMNKNHIHYKFNISLFAKTKTYHSTLKKAIVYYDESLLVETIAQIKTIQGFYKDIYPHKIEYYVLKKLEQCYLKREAFTKLDVKKLYFLLDFVSYDMSIIIIHMIYFDCRRRKRLLSSLRNVISNLPLIGKDEILYKTILLHQKFNDQQFEEALLLAIELEEECKQTGNYTRLCEVMQMKIAIYSATRDKHALQKVRRQLHEYTTNYEIAYYVKNENEHYLGISAFVEHDFHSAKHYFEKIIIEKRDTQPQFMKLFYCSLISYLNLENSLFVLNEQLLNRYEAHQKVFLRYFLLKHRKKSIRILVNYIFDKIVPILDKDYVFESNIFLQELYLLSTSKEIKKEYIYKLNESNCVILQDWMQVFKRL